MVLVTNSSRIDEIGIIAKSKALKIIAYGLGKAKGLDDAYGNTVNFAPCPIIDEDLITSIVEGHTSLKKAVKKHVKSLTNLDKLDNPVFPVAMATILNALTDRDNIAVVFVQDNNIDPVVVARDRVVRKFIEQLFKALGIVVMNKLPKSLKKALKIKKKKKQVAKFMQFRKENKKYFAAEKTHAIRGTIFAANTIELHQIGLANLALSDLSRKTINNLAKDMTNVFTGQNLNAYADAVKTPNKKTAKRIMKKNKQVVKLYNELIKIIDSAGYTIKGHVKAKYGVTKKGEPAMGAKKIKKFIKTMSDKRPSVLITAYAYIASRLIDDDTSAKSQLFKTMKTVNTRLHSEDFSKDFAAAAKNYFTAKDASNDMTLN